MNFNIVEGKYVDFDSIHDDFCNDYLFSNELDTVELRKKYGLTVKEFKEFSKQVKMEYGFSRRPRKQSNGQYYYKRKYGWAIQKNINGNVVYFGFVTSKDVAKKLVELCKEAGWNIPVCLDIVKNWRCYIGS